MINTKNFLQKKLNLKAIKIKAKELLFLSANLDFNTSQISKKTNDFLIKKEKTFHILSIIKIAKIIFLAQKIIFIMAKNRKRILFVSTNNNTSNFLINNFQDLFLKNCFYITSRWIGGLITNWKNFRNKFLLLKKTKDKLSKKEQIMHNLELEKFEKSFKGIKNLDGLPNLIIFLSISNKKIAISECKKFSIPTIGLSDNFDSSEKFDITIPINSQSFSTIKYIIKEFINTILKAYNK
jgi:small subunit ribosomal protein S2